MLRTYVAAGVVGGYCREPGECLCREGFSGDNCSIRGRGKYYIQSCVHNPSLHYMYLGKGLTSHDCATILDSIAKGTSFCMVHPYITSESFI